MHKSYSKVKEMIKSNPLPLHTLPPDLLKMANSYLPYSVGIEIECDMPDERESLSAFDQTRLDRELHEKLEKVPGVVSVACGSELRLRIKNGVEGMITLYNALEVVKKYCLLNPASGIHYHVDCTDIDRHGDGNIGWSDFSYFCENKKNANYILDCLRSWNYTGSFNQWMVSNSKNAVRLHSTYRTMEYRIGEMSFDYSLIIQRMIHACNITRVMKGKYLREKQKRVDEYNKNRNKRNLIPKVPFVKYAITNSR